MSAYVTRLLEERARAWEQAKALLDVAAAENRDLTGEEEETYARITADLDQLRARADKLVEDEKASHLAEEALRKLANEGREEHATSDDGNGNADKLRSFLKGETRSVDLMPNLKEIRALSKGTATAGGHTVPTSFYGKLWLHLIETANLLNAGATILTTDSGEALEIPVTTSHGAAAAVAEAGTLAGTDPAFAKRTLGSFKYGQLVLLSRELVDDTGVDIEGYVAKAAGWALGNIFGQKLIVGAGTTEPFGISAQSTLGVTSSTGVVGVPTFDNLIDLFYSVIAPYRNSPATGWLFKDSTAAVLRKIKGSDGQYIWQPSVIAGTPDMILSKPVHTDPYMPGTGLNNKSIIFGDLSAYVARIVNGVRFDRSDEYGFATDQIAFRAIIRGDGLLVDQTGAVKHFVGAAS